MTGLFDDAVGNLHDAGELTGGVVGVVQRDGFDAVLQYFGRLRTRSSAAAFAASFGQTLQDFEREVLPYLKRAMGDSGPQQP